MISYLCGQIKMEKVQSLASEHDCDVINSNPQRILLENDGRS